MPKAYNEEVVWDHEADHNAHVYAWKHAVDEDFQRFLSNRGPRLRDQYRRSPTEWLRYQRLERRRRNERLDSFIDTHEKRFFDKVSQAKPFTDYFGLFSLHMLLSGLFLAFCEQLIKTGWSNRTAAAIFFTAVYGFSMFRAFSQANDAFVDMAILKIVRWFSLPNPPDVNLKSFRVIWAITLVLLHWGLIAGSSFVGYDLSRRVVEQVMAKPPVHNQFLLP